MCSRPKALCDRDCRYPRTLT
uniref:Uncharacterized protein n=1 Tax=Arundo donax TaxID=35708 RepID=A0A0A8ZQX8_ARUDO